MGRQLFNKLSLSLLSELSKALLIFVASSGGVDTLAKGASFLESSNFFAILWMTLPFFIGFCGAF